MNNKLISIRLISVHQRAPLNRQQCKSAEIKTTLDACIASGLSCTEYPSDEGTLLVE